MDASSYAEHFVVKGGLSLFARYHAAARPTQDLDLAASGFPNTLFAVREALIEILGQPFPDGLTFDIAAVTVREMQIESQYSGVAASVTAVVGRAKQVLPLDISFGNVITPAPVQLSFPQLLLPEAVSVRVYPLETVIAEKFAALLELGLLTTRMKDLYDLWVIAGRETFKAGILSYALIRSFRVRGTPPLEAVITASFKTDSTINQRWKTYLRRTGLQAEPDFAVLMEQILSFVQPVINTKLNAEAIWKPTERRWELY